MYQQVLVPSRVINLTSALARPEGVMSVNRTILRTYSVPCCSPVMTLLPFEKEMFSFVNSLSWIILYWICWYLVRASPALGLDQEISRLLARILLAVGGLGVWGWTEKHKRITHGDLNHVRLSRGSHASYLAINNENTRHEPVDLWTTNLCGRMKHWLWNFTIQPSRSDRR